MNAPANSLHTSVASRLEAALSGSRPTDQALRDIVDICDSDADAPWEVLALVDQYYRRGRIDDATFRGINSQIQRFAVGGPAARAATRAALRGVPPGAAARATVPALRFPVHGAAPHRVMPAGTVLADRYVLEEPIDHGTPDTVYRAVDRYRAELPDEEQRVAVKFPAATEAHRQFFRAQGLAHPNINRVLECGRSGAMDFYTLDFQHGKLLRDVLRDMASAMPKAHALHIIREVGSAVAYAHGQGVVHGALDSKSILITVDGGIRVLNFDAPQAQHTDPRHDLRALACIAYELLAGKRPLTGLRARRPRRMSWRHWRSLKQGLNGSTAVNKPVAVRDWLASLELDRAARGLPMLAQLLTGKPRRRWTLVKATATAAFALAGALAATLPVRLDAGDTGAAGSAAAAGRSAPAADERPGRIGFAAEAQSVAADAAAVRILVRRTSGSRGDIGFSWWTEDGSARAGADYMSLGTRQMTMPDGQDSATLFVPLVAPGAQPGSSDFTVALGSPTGGATLGGISRLTVTLAPRH